MQAEVVKVIKTVNVEGGSHEGLPVRSVYRYWSEDGTLLAVHDEAPPNPKAEELRALLIEREGLDELVLDDGGCGCNVMLTPPCVRCRALKDIKAIRKRIREAVWGKGQQ